MLQSNVPNLSVWKETCIDGNQYPGKKGTSLHDEWTKYGWNTTTALFLNKLRFCQLVRKENVRVAWQDEIAHLFCSAPIISSSSA